VTFLDLVAETPPLTHQPQGMTTKPEFPFLPLAGEVAMIANFYSSSIIVVELLLLERQELGTRNQNDQGH
jgi:hypothetical protein